MEPNEAVSRCLTALLNGQVREAVEISCNHSGGAGELYEKETVSLVECILSHDYTPDPSIKEKVLQPLRVVAAALELWGENDLKQYAEVSGDWTYRFKPEEVIKLLYAAGLEAHRLSHLRENGIKQVEIRSTSSPLPDPCREHAGKTFPADRAPVLPHRTPDCRCRYVGPGAGTREPAG